MLHGTERGGNVLLQPYVPLGTESKYTDNNCMAAMLVDYQKELIRDDHQHGDDKSDENQLRESLL